MMLILNLNDAFSVAIELKAITLRNVPPEIAEAISARAREKGTSINKTVVGMLEELLGSHGEKKRHRDHEQGGCYATIDSESRAHGPFPTWFGVDRKRVSGWAR